MEINNFLEDIVQKDLESGKIKEVITRFPPEPNGYLHLGHAKSLCINFGIANKFGGKCNLRFDDTNPTKEEDEYVEAIKQNIIDLGFKWNELHFASDYFETIYELAVKLIKKGKAYVCELTGEQIRESRGTLTAVGANSPYRDRSVDENLKLFEEMRAGKYKDGEKVLRAKIDMSSPNINMRDPVIYRILHASHHRTGDKWCIYPMYDFTHPISDAVEKITHSFCTLEFEDHRPLYDWVVNECDFEHKPRQIEFARLNLTKTIMSKRYLKKLVDENVVDGWDDSRMPTLSGVKKRGYSANAIKNFCEAIGVSKAGSEVDIAMLEHFIRDDLNTNANRAMVVLNPVLCTIKNYKGEEMLDIHANPNDENSPVYKAPFSNQIYIDASDFEIEPPAKYHRLKPDGYVRLKGAYIIKCEDYVLNDDGSVKEVVCSYEPSSKSGNDTSGIKVKGVIQWVDAKKNIKATVNKYDYLLRDADFSGQDFSERINVNSKQTVENAICEIVLKDAKVFDRYQFMRVGYFVTEANDAKKGLVFGEIVSLKDSYKA